MSRAWSGGSTRAWRRARALVLARNRVTHAGQCELGIPTLCTGRATHVHHPYGKAAGDNPRDLQATCASCNLHIGDPTTHDPHCKLCCAPKETVRPKRMTSW